MNRLGIKSNQTISVLDPGIPFEQFLYFSRLNKKFVTHYKFGWASCFLLDDFEDRVNHLKNIGVESYCGGSLFELAFRNNDIDNFEKFIKKKGIKTIELSNGSTNIDTETMMHFVEKFSSKFNVLFEVGKKDPIQSEEMYPEIWINQINSALEKGASEIILEGRESSNSGIFRSNGNLRTGLLLEITSHCPLNKLIFEASKKHDQISLIKKFGPSLGFGNISPYSVIKLIALIKGLRADTLSENKGINWGLNNE